LKTLNPNNDHELLKRVILGDKDAFTALFKRYSRQLYYISLKYTGKEEDAEDIVQEVFSKIWIVRNCLKPDKQFMPYIVKIAKNQIFNKSKRRLIEMTYLKYKKEIQNAGQHTTEEQLNLKEFKYLVKTEINHLSPKRKEIYILSREHGLSNKEIASKLNISTSTVENHINKVLNTLRENLKYSSYI